MPISKNYINFILEQLSDINQISCKQMMGEYIIYHNEKLQLMSVMTDFW